MRLLEWTLLGFGLLVLLVGHHEVSSDGRVRFAMLSALFRDGLVSPSPYSLVGPLFSSPLWWLGQVCLSSEWWCSYYNLLLFVLGLGLLDCSLRTMTSGPVRRRFLLLMMFGSMFFYHVRLYYGEVFTVVLVSVGVFAVVHESWAGWVCIALGVANIPASAVGLLFVVLAWCWHTRRLRYGLALLAGAALILLEAGLRRGNLLSSGYEGNHGFRTALPYSGLPGFSYPFFFGLLSILLSFGKGLVFFLPGLFLPIRSAQCPCNSEARWAHRLLLLFLVGLVLVYARWWAWYGGVFWGPRFFLIGCIPASLALAVGLVEAPRQSLGRNLVVLGILALSCWVGLNGAVFGNANLDMCWANQYALEMMTWYVPEMSCLWRPFVVRGPLSRWEWANAALFFGAFLTLAAPLVLVLARQIAEQARDLWRREACLPWRF